MRVFFVSLSSVKTNGKRTHYQVYNVDGLRGSLPYNQVLSPRHWGILLLLFGFVLAFVGFLFQHFLYNVGK